MGKIHVSLICLSTPLYIWLYLFRFFFLCCAHQSAHRKQQGSSCMWMIVTVQCCQIVYVGRLQGKTNGSVMDCWVTYLLSHIHPQNTPPKFFLNRVILQYVCHCLHDGLGRLEKTKESIRQIQVYLWGDVFIEQLLLMQRVHSSITKWLAFFRLRMETAKHS